MFTKSRNKLLKTALATLLIILLAMSPNSFGYDEVVVLDREPYEYRKMWVTNAAVVRLNPTLRAAAGAVFITVELADIRYRIDGGDPDDNDGHPITAGQNFWLSDSYAIENLRIIAAGATGARVVVTFYK